MIETATASVLIVDDDKSIREPLAEFLSSNGLIAQTAPSAAAARQILAYSKVDLVVLDVMMPGEDGLEFCRQLRRESAIPVIFVSALGDEVDRIIGIEMGGDDYLAKPFSPRELLARIRAVLRRPAVILGGESSTPARPRFGGWTFDQERRELVDTDGRRVALSAYEHRLLQAFIRRPGILLTRDQLLLEMHGDHSMRVFDRSIDNQVSRLRAKLGDDARNPMFIKTAHGDGYMFVAEISDK
jgi:two-component system OmpR family response regulator